MEVVTVRACRCLCVLFCLSVCIAAIYLATLPYFPPPMSPTYLCFLHSLGLMLRMSRIVLAMHMSDEGGSLCVAATTFSTSRAVEEGRECRDEMPMERASGLCFDT